MSTAQLLVETAEGVRLVTLNRPEAMNAFGGTMRADLLRALQSAEADADVRCVVVTGAGKAFCAGGDIASMAGLQAQDTTGDLPDRMRRAAEIVQLLRSMSKPVVAAVNGAAAGAGLILALACDLRLASDGARFSASFVKIGLMPDWGGTYLLTRALGVSKAMELMMTGARIDAAEALRLGLLNRVMPDATFRLDAIAFARELARGPAQALEQIKRATYLGASGTLADSLRFEEAAQLQLFLTPDAREGMQAFLEKRPARFGNAR
jgi:2-(1,2-epoxy-1,2-dihydrophenyl)acetyl-CoA isomerase